MNDNYIQDAYNDLCNNSFTDDTIVCFYNIVYSHI